MPIHDWSKVPDAVFHALHVAWLGRLQDLLNTRLLPEPFHALTETVTGEAVPDVITLQAREPYAPLARRLVVRNEWEGDRIVAVLEPVSRSNKASRAKAEQFVTKVVDLLLRGIHLLVIDLHPPSSMIPAGFHSKVCEQYGDEPLRVPPERDRSAASYQVLETGKVRSHVVPFCVGDVLPEMALFLLPHKFVRVPLEETYAEAFHGLPGKFRGQLEGRS
jgi:hypothetical protein